jgi:hypothetical protein
MREESTEAGSMRGKAERGPRCELYRGGAAVIVRGAHIRDAGAPRVGRPEEAACMVSSRLTMQAAGSCLCQSFRGSTFSARGPFGS